MLRWPRKPQTCRRTNNPITKGIPSKIFFEYLLLTYSAILTDYEHTDSGERFWMDRVADAFENHLNVYHVNFIAGQLKDVILQIEDNDHFLELKEQGMIWGKDLSGKSTTYSARRILITHKNLLTSI